jgi:hypothetical protein
VSRHSQALGARTVRRSARMRTELLVRLNPAMVNRVSPTGWQDSKRAPRLLATGRKINPIHSGSVNQSTSAVAVLNPRLTTSRFFQVALLKRNRQSLYPIVDS